MLPSKDILNIQLEDDMYQLTEKKCDRCDTGTGIIARFFDKFPKLKEERVQQAKDAFADVSGCGKRCQRP